METIVIFAFGALGLIIYILGRLKQSLESDSSKIQSLLAEIRDRLDDKNQG